MAEEVRLELKTSRKRRLAASSGAEPGSSKRDRWADDDDDPPHHGGETSQESSPALVIPLVAQGPQDLPLLLRGRAPQRSRNDRDRLEHDLADRPDALSAQYENVPIEEFGSALLRGMGWTDGLKPADEKGRSRPRAVELRPALLGLGALPEAEKKPAKTPGETRREDGRHWLRPRALVKVVKGRHEGQVAVVKQSEAVPGLNNVIVVMDPGEFASLVDELPQVMLKRDQLRELSRESSLELSRLGDALLRRFDEEVRKAQEKEKREKEERREKEKGEVARSGREEERARKKDRETRRSEETRRCWVASGIRVRIMSKSLGGGKFFGKKAVVQDVLDKKKGVCILTVGEGREECTLENVRQRQLDTALPKKGGQVLVVGGKYAGERGILLDRNHDKNRVSVQLQEDLHVTSLPFEDVAEYCF